ncbi:MAG TPA: hypothetical protein GX507_05480 [Clostridia bacterium]|nr:hypothetical protein [Clostridia bacterium]
MRRTGLLGIPLLCSVVALNLLIIAMPGLAATGIGVSPGRFEVEVKPGEIYEGTLTVSNEGDGPIEIKSYALDRRVRSGGNIDFLEPGNPNESPAAWLRVEPSEFTLLPHQEEEITWKMLVPQDAIPGDYVGAIFFEHTPQARPGAVSIGGRVGAVVSVRVMGQVVVSGDLEDFKVSPAPIAFGLSLFGKSLLSFSWTPPFSLYESGPVRIVATFKNTGTVRLSVTGEVTIKDIFGRTIQVLSPQEPLNVYPRDTDSMILLLEDVPAIGRFTAIGRFSIGEKEVASQAVFYVFPVKKVISAILLGVGIWLLAKSRRRPSRRPAGLAPAGQGVKKRIREREYEAREAESIGDVPLPWETALHPKDRVNRGAPRNTSSEEKEVEHPGSDRIPSRSERKRRKRQ